LRFWLKKFPAPAGGAGPEVGLRAENKRLREENKRLLLEREILKKATAFFARHQP
jgi:transposase